MKKSSLLLLVLLLTSCNNEELEKEVRQQRDKEWNARELYLKLKREEIEYCRFRGGVPITKRDTDVPGYWGTPDTAFVLTRCDFPPVATKQEQVEK